MKQLYLTPGTLIPLKRSFFRKITEEPPDTLFHGTLKILCFNSVLHEIYRSLIQNREFWAFFVYFGSTQNLFLAHF